MEEKNGTKKSWPKSVVKQATKRHKTYRKQVAKWQKLLLINKALNVTGSKYSIERQVLAEWNKIKIWCNSMLLQECHFIYKYTNTLKFKGPSYKLQPKRSWNSYILSDKAKFKSNSIAGEKRDIHW